MKSERGSAALAILFTSFLGVGFVLLFWNLLQFSSTTGAMREAARVTARCITPTDPECVRAVNVAAEAPMRQWWGYGQGTQQVFSFVPIYQYRAALSETIWNASYESWEVLRRPEAYELSSYQARNRTFGRIEASSVPFGSLTTSYRGRLPQTFRPLHSPNFPNFEQNLTMGSAQWLSAQSPLAFKQSTTTTTLNQGDVELLSTEIVSVPRLNNEANAICADENGRLCDVSNLVGGRPDTSRWATTAFLAIKVFAFVEPRTTTAEVRWSEAPNQPGLYVSIFDEQGKLTARRCLGGRSAETIRRGGEWYNLWLRGPSGAHGGESAICPDGSVRHDQIAIPRGGSYQIHAYLRNISGMIDATITIAHYVDDYRQNESGLRQIDCEPERYQGFSEERSCISLAECNPICSDGRTPCDKDPKFNWQMTSCAANREGIKHICNHPDPLPTQASPTTIVAATCTDNWRPSPTLADGTEVEAGTTCGWNVTNETSVAIAAIPPNCPLAVQQPVSGTCSTELLVGEAANQQNCPDAFEQRAAIEAATKELNFKQPKGAIKFPEQAELRFTAGGEPQWKAELQAPAGGNAGNSRKVQSKTAVDLPTLTTIIGPQTPPPLSSFYQTFKDQWGLGASSVDQLVTTNKLTIVETGKRQLPIASVYPFQKPEREIYYGQTDASASWDFNRDCLHDAYCSGSQTFESEEAMLRFHASKENPEALNTGLVFTSGKQPMGMEHFDGETRSEAQAHSLPACTPTRTHCPRTPTGGATFLGESQSTPEACSSGSMINCFSKVIGTEPTVNGPEIITDIDRARQLGLEEVRRISPPAYLADSCDDEPYCTEIAVDPNVNDYAVVRIRHQVPLQFPLSTFLNQRTLSIEYTKQEILERTLAHNR